MIQLRIAPSALNDLASIWTYTDETWGQERADNYIAAIHLSIDRLCTFPELGAPHSSKVGTFRKLSSGRHLIFYQFDDPIITVVRLLHVRMDVETQLGA